MAFMLTSIIQFILWTLCSFQEILCIYVLINMGQFTCSNYKVPSPMWFVHFGLVICVGAQPTSCSHMVDHTRIAFHVHVNTICKSLLLGGKYDVFLCYPKPL